jgi:hypothetical protein
LASVRFQKLLKLNLEFGFSSFSQNRLSPELGSVRSHKMPFGSSVRIIAAASLPGRDSILQRLASLTILRSCFVLATPSAIATRISAIPLSALLYAILRGRPADIRL